MEHCTASLGGYYIIGLILLSHVIGRTFFIDSTPVQFIFFFYQFIVTKKVLFYCKAYLIWYLKYKCKKATNKKVPFINGCVWNGIVHIIIIRCNVKQDT